MSAITSQMSRRHLKAGYFILEGLNSFASVYYLFYLYFFMQTQFGFGNTANLELAAFNGMIYMIGSFWGGRFAQRFGYFTALKLGFGTMIAALSAGLLTGSAAGVIGVTAVLLLGMSFTWPTLEALVSEGESPYGVQHMIGIYNIVWAGTGALAYFSGGVMLTKLGLKSLYWLPIVVQLGQLTFTLRLERQAVSNKNAALDAEPETDGIPAGASRLNPRPIAKARTFLKMAWVANPFAYIAINTVIAVSPGVARKLGLTTAQAGFCCSIWCFARLGAFVGLWQWAGWQYRFRWLLAAYLMLMASFAWVLLAPNVPSLVITQIAFGCALGLIYYSSLFYSMDLSESKSEQGGIHEAAIGLGNFAGPAVGAASLHFLPEYTSSGMMAVSILLLFGLAGLGTIWVRGTSQRVRLPIDK